MKYTATYWHNSSDTPETMTFNAIDDDDAIRQVKAFVEFGYRNETGLNMTLSDGSSYGVSNKHGMAVGGRSE